MQPLRDLILVSELQDAEEVYAPGGTVAFYWPETEHSESCCGIIAAIGPEVRDFAVGDRIVYYPYSEIDRPRPYTRIIRERDIVGVLLPNGEMLPASNLVVIEPDWSDAFKKGSLIIPAEAVPGEPRVKGTCLRVGRHVSLVRPGQKVLIPAGLDGWEVGIKNKVFYVLNEHSILATLED